MEHVTNDKRDWTSPSLLHSFLFSLFSSSPPVFLLLCTFLFSFSIYPAPWHLSFTTHAFCTYIHFQILIPCICRCGPACHFYPFCLSCHLCPCVLICITETSNLSTFFLKLTDFPLLPVCAFSFRSLLHSPCLSLLVVTSSGAPSLPPTPIVLSQLGCGLDGSGSPLPSPRLQQQHQPQIQVIQQL